MISGSLHPWSAIRFEPPLRTPCGTQRSGNPASSHHLRNAVLNAFLLYGLPHSLVKNVREPGGLGQASIVYESASYIARRDDPGLCPGDGWQLVCGKGSRGSRGETGPRGEKGERGPSGRDAPTIISWAIDRVHYRAVPTMSDGTPGPALELRGLFERFVEETSYAVEAP